MKNYRLHRFISNIVFFRSAASTSRSETGKVSTFGTQLIFLFFGFCFLVSLVGCEAFVRKFTRKPKKAKFKKEEVVLVPRDYSSSDITVEDKYRQYFLFWRSWQDELIAALNPSGNHKRRRGCLEEAIKNLENIKPLLFEEKQNDLDVYLEQLYRLQDEIGKDIHGSSLVRHKNKTKRLKRNILRDFSYSKIKDHLK